MSFNLDELIDKSLETLRKEFIGSDDEFDKKVNEKLPNIIESLEEIFKEGLIKFYNEKILSEIRNKEQKFKDRLYDDYKVGFDFLQIFIDINKYCGKRVLKELEDLAQNKHSLKRSLLFRLQARACQVATEIQTLLRYGYPDGAHARWRTLHELSVTFLILFENSEEISEMYFDYYVIENEKRAQEFEKHHHRINWPPLDENELKRLRTRKEELLNKYGTEYGLNYGWTLKLLPKKDRNFKSLEKLANLDYMRPFFAWANNNIHSGIGGLTSRLGQIDQKINSYLVFTGPTYYGLADPAQFTSSSLCMITCKLLSLYEDLESQIFVTLLLELDSKMKTSFFECQEKIKKEYYDS